MKTKTSYFSKIQKEGQKEEKEGEKMGKFGIPLGTPFPGGGRAAAVFWLAFPKGGLGTLVFPLGKKAGIPLGIP